MLPPLTFCSINLEVVSMIDAAKLLQLFYAYKKTSFANGSVLLGTVFYFSKDSTFVAKYG